MLTEATKKYRDIFAFGLVGVATLFLLSGLSLLFKSGDDLGGAGFSEKAVLFGPVFTGTMIIAPLVLAVVVACAGEASTNAKSVVLAALGVGGVAALFAVITWFAGYAVDDQGGFGLSYGGVAGAGKIVGTLLNLGAIGAIGLALFFMVAVFQRFPKAAPAQQQWGQQPGQQGWGQPAQQWGQPGQQGWGQQGQWGQQGYAGGWGDQSQAQAQQQGQPASAWSQQAEQPQQQGWGDQPAGQGWGQPQDQPGQHWGQPHEQQGWGRATDQPESQGWGQQESSQQRQTTAGQAEDETQAWSAESRSGERGSDEGASGESPGGKRSATDDDEQQPPQRGWWTQQ